MSLTIEAFRQEVMDFYRQHGRQLPWRQTADPYAILVSEVMLQQTQVERVNLKYKAWLDRFPDFQTLSQATPAAVLQAFQGLGYNRRALNLRQTAIQVVAYHQGQLPREEKLLLALPGIGKYTARAIQAFAFNLPVILIETNIRTVFIHHYFPQAAAVDDSEIYPLLAAALPADQPRDWYNALMDYGATIKQKYGNPNQKSRQYRPQSRFTGSRRQLRGAIVRLLLDLGPLTQTQLSHHTCREQPEVAAAVAALVKEGVLEKRQGRYTIEP